MHTILLSEHCYMSFVLVSVFATADFYRKKKKKSNEFRNHKNVIFSYLNINSVRNKFDNLKLVDELVDILYVVETKIGNSFPISVGLDIIRPIL